MGLPMAFSRWQAHALSMGAMAPNRVKVARLRTTCGRCNAGCKNGEASWRGIMAYKLVYAASDETPAAQHPMRELVLVDGGPER